MTDPGTGDEWDVRITKVEGPPYKPEMIDQFKNAVERYLLDQPDITERGEQ